MTRESVSVEELIAALNELKAQVEWIVERGHGAFVASTSEAGVLQLAVSHAVIRLQAIIEDFPEGFTQNNSDLPFPLVRGMRGLGMAELSRSRAFPPRAGHAQPNGPWLSRDRSADLVEDG